MCVTKRTGRFYGQQAQHKKLWIYFFFFFFRSSYMLTAFQNLTKSTHVTLVRVQLWDCFESSFQKTKGSWHSCLKHLALHLTLDQGFIWWHLMGLHWCQQSSSAELSQNPSLCCSLCSFWTQKGQSLTQQVQLTGFWMLFTALAKERARQEKSKYRAVSL